MFWQKKQSSQQGIAILVVAVVILVVAVLAVGSIGKEGSNLTGAVKSPLSLAPIKPEIPKSVSTYKPSRNLSATVNKVQTGVEKAVDAAIIYHCEQTYNLGDDTITPGEQTIIDQCIANNGRLRNGVISRVFQNMRERTLLKDLATEIQLLLAQYQRSGVITAAVVAAYSEYERSHYAEDGLRALAGFIQTIQNQPDMKVKYERPGYISGEVVATIVDKFNKKYPDGLPVPEVELTGAVISFLSDHIETVLSQVLAANIIEDTIVGDKTAAIVAQIKIYMSEEPIVTAVVNIVNWFEDKKPVRNNINVLETIDAAFETVRTSVNNRICN